ncbi:hypothetical protein KORDIASMS9_03427 [Kordia sp. SMS9]|uniref:hypothetical protein n=1 Tax=Kordia sp. SMS9 TaxID=2282170 RepID=UPI000E0D31D3|nr:hypothetical protein [Kordia sp. SMS9]AXG71172.1 hypothetical protein KORDIASMS9_03427 [Kordia sp. SMS9]
MKKKSFKKFEFKVHTISNLQNKVLGGAADEPIKHDSYENSCMAGYCRSINEISRCYPCD